MDLGKVSPGAITSMTYSNARGDQRINVRGIARPDPDLDKLARALLQLAEQLGEDKEAG